MKCSTIAVVAALSLLSSASAAEETKHFPHPSWMSWLHIDCPARFEMDPKSLKGERKWWAKFNDPDSDLSVEVMSYGYVNDLDLFLTIPSIDHKKLDEDTRSIEERIATDAKYKNIGGYFKSEILPKGCKASKHSGFERFIAVKKEGIVVYFLDADAYERTFGSCYKTLTFSFSAGTYSKHQKVVESIIASSNRSPQTSSEQVGADQPAAAPKSKAEDK